MAGLGYYGQCYCGQSVKNDKLSEDKCNFPCNGNSGEICGGDNAVSVYSDPSAPPLSSVSVADYASVGCWTDDAPAPYGKALFYRQEDINPDTLTKEICLAACLEKGYPYAGTEYSRECYCGVDIGSGTALATDQSACNMPCTGDKSQTCGGDALLSLYVAKKLFPKDACVTPVLPSASTSSVASSTTSSSTSSTGATTSSAASTTSSTMSITSTSTIRTTSSTTTGPSQCTATIVTPPKCEFSCGSWCASPLPDFDNQAKCLTAWSTCKVQLASCFFKAGWPDAMNCFKYAGWCSKVKDYCFSGANGGKNGCYNKYPPISPGKASTTTSVYPCSTTSTRITTTSTATTTTSTCIIPTPTGICKQPTDNRYGYGPGKPVGGIELPLVTCNNDRRDFGNGNPFKLYTDNDSSKCRSYRRPDYKGACQDACKWQYNQCLSVYAQGCKTSGKVGGNYYGGDYNPSEGTRPGPAGPGGRRTSRSSHAEEVAMIKRSADQFSQSYGDAQNSCRAQYQDCLSENYWVRDNGSCKTFAADWA